MATDSTTIIIAAITGITGVSGTAAGTFLAWKLKENTDRRQWWRQEQLTAVSRLLTDVSNFIFSSAVVRAALAAGVAVKTSDPPSPNVERARDEYFRERHAEQDALLRQIHASVDVLKLMLPIAHHDKVQQIWTVCFQLGYAVLTASELPSIQPINDAIDALHSAVRVELQSPE